jgi:LysM repeat protein
MKRLLVLLLFVLAAHRLAAQDFEIVNHQVKLGETVRMIAVRYKVPPSEIYKLNKFAVDGIHQGQVLQIMVPKKDEPPTEPSTETAETQSAETAGPDDVVRTTTTTTTTTIHRKKSVPAQQESLQPANDAGQPSLGSEGAASTHTVAPGETLFGIARQHNMTVADLKARNAAVLKNGLHPGQILTIITSAQSDPPAQTASATSDGGEPQMQPASNPETVNHTVSKGETLFSLARLYHTTVDAIKAQNPSLEKGMQAGQVLTITPNP